jgi:xanthine dehydrogenase small subunit
MSEINFILNNELVSIEINPAEVLLDFIRKQKHLTGTKEGCKEGDCGACTVLIGALNGNKVEYKSINSCLFPIGSANYKHIVTIEGINSEQFTAVQENFIKEGASQCGFCTPGFCVSLTGYIINCTNYNYHDAINAIAGNICRCTGYTSIKNVLKNLGSNINIKYSDDKISQLIKLNFLPAYFSGIPSRLKEIKIIKSNGAGTKINKIISGGTDLFVQNPDELLETETYLIGDRNLSFINTLNNTCIVGATTTFEMIKESKVFRDHFPRLDHYMDLIASLPIRNSATIGGNFVNASPIGDTTIFFLALNSTLNLIFGNDKRKILLKDLYKGYKSLNLKPGEYVESLEFKLPGTDSQFNFEKVSKRFYLDIASVNSAISLEVKSNIIYEAHVSAGGVAPIPLYLKNTSEFLTNKKIETGLVEEAVQIIQDEITPISDVRGSAEYKRVLIGQLFKAHFIELFPEIIKMEELV